MKYIAIVALFLLSACSFVVRDDRPEPVRIATQTARAEAAVPVTIEPAVAPEATATPECNIKVNWNGTEWIYHLPDQPTYARTLVEPSKGEFFACTEADAQAHGARKAQR